MKCTCDKCDAVAACKYTFGKFWRMKSLGGRGCNSPFIPADGWQPPITVALLAAARKAETK